MGISYFVRGVRIIEIGLTVRNRDGLEVRCESDEKIE
jgi:hypothetical protein